MLKLIKRPLKPKADWKKSPALSTRRIYNPVRHFPSTPNLRSPPKKLGREPDDRTATSDRLEARCSRTQDREDELSPKALKIIRKVTRERSEHGLEPATAFLCRRSHSPTGVKQREPPLGLREIRKRSPARGSSVAMGLMFQPRTSIPLAPKSSRATSRWSP